MQKGIVKISVARWVPVLLIIIGPLRARQQSLLQDTWVSRLVEGRDSELLVGVFLDDTQGILMGIERGHEDEGYIDLVSRVEVLDLADSEIEESHVVFDLQGTFGASHT